MAWSKEAKERVKARHREEKRKKYLEDLQSSLEDTITQLLEIPPDKYCFGNLE